MLNLNDCRHVLSLASVYKRIFSVLFYNMELVHTIRLNGANIELITKKCPLVLLSFFVLIAGVVGILQEFNIINGLPSTEDIAMCIAICFHCATIMMMLIHSACKYREIHVIWCTAYELTRYTLKELGHKVCFRHFWKHYLGCSALIMTAFGVSSSLRLLYRSPRIILRTQISIIVLQGVVIYIAMHALFIVQLFNYFVRLFIKCIYLDYRSRMRDSTVGPVARPIIAQLRLYQQFYHKLWRMVESINQFFSFTILILNYHAFFSVAFSSYYIFLYIVRDDAPYLLIRNL